MEAEDVVEEIKQNRNASCAAHHQRFFKTGPGEYGEGDLFHGLRVPLVRQIAKKFRQTPLEEIKKLLEDPYHECRMAALFILIDYFSRSGEDEKAAAVELYLGSTDFINNWDLVDLSCYKLLGPWLKKRDRAVLYRLSESDSLWEQRISIITTMHFIRCGDFIEALAISEKLLNHPHDLIHKAVGWMLREAGNRDKAAEDGFLRSHYRQMPRTMLRYAIEKYPEAERQAYLKGRI
jgi:3-methyladenine DNA glycosylase AlkD